MSPLDRVFDAIVVLGTLGLLLFAAFVGAAKYARRGSLREKSRVRARRDRAIAFAFPFGFGLFLLFVTLRRSHQFGHVIPIQFGNASMQPWQGYAAAAGCIVLALSTLLFRRRKDGDRSDG